jgi:hypothetical protein
LRTNNECKAKTRYLTRRICAARCADYEPPAEEAPPDATPPPPPPPAGDGDAPVDAEEAALAARMAARMAAAERAAAAAAAALLDARRDALLTCVETAHASYRWPWAQTTVDMLVDAAQAASADKFSPAQRERLQRTYTAVRDARHRRRFGGGKGGGGGEPTSFERGAARFAGADISIRRAVGSGMGNDGRGEACAGTLNKMG